MQGVIVSGVGNGMGCAIARYLSEKGFRVAVMSRSDGGKHVANMIGADFLRCDLRDPDSVREALDIFTGRGGSLDHVVHAAGGYFRKASIAETDFQFFADAVMNNAATFFNIVKAAVPLMKGKWGSITAVSAARHVYINSNPGYAAGKGAINLMVEEMAKELAPVNIRVNAVAPGFISKESCGSGAEETLLGKGRHPAIPVAMTVHWLISGQAVTGQVVTVDSGFSLQLPDGL